MAGAVQHPSTWLNIPRGQLQVPPPGQDGRSYYVSGVHLDADTEGNGKQVLRYGGGDPRQIEPSGRILANFVRLGEIPDGRFPQAAADFAASYGVLGICRHGKPGAHAGCDRLMDEDSQARELEAIRIGIETGNEPPTHGWRFYEPLEAWRRYARQLRAILGIIARLQEGCPGLAEDWDAVIAGDPRKLGPLDYAAVPPDEIMELRLSRPDFHRMGFGQAIKDAGRVEVERGVICMAVETWIRYGGIRLGVEWEPGETHARSHHRVDGLPGALAAWLVAAMQGTVYVCSGCGTPFALEEGRKRVPANKNRWCDRCGRPAMLRAAQRRHYAAKGGKTGSADSQSDSRAAGRGGSGGGRIGRPPGG